MPVGGVYLPSEDYYDVAFLLTEESFHSCGTQHGGCWAATMSGAAYFSIPVCIVDLNKLNLMTEEWLMTSNELIFDLDDSNDVNFIDYSIFAHYWLNCCPNDWWLK